MTPDNVQVAIPEEPRASEPVEPEERTTALVRWEDRPQGWTFWWGFGLMGEMECRVLWVPVLCPSLAEEYSYMARAYEQLVQRANA